MTLYLNHLGITCALGDHPHQVAQNMFAATEQAHSPLQLSTAFSPDRPFMLGMVSHALPEIQAAQWQMYQCRNNRMLLHCLQQIDAPVSALREQFGAHRIGVALGTSTSGIAEAEGATAERLETGRLPERFHFMQQQLGGGADFIADYLQLNGPTSTVSTACSSSANALANAARMFELDQVDAVIVGGADTLCQFTVQGFAALDAMSSGLSNPFSRNRDGINIGEGAALFVMSRAITPDSAEIALMGVGSSSDAHHISAPHPDGEGAQRAMLNALDIAGMQPSQIQYVNLHGTGTRQNDAAESRAIAAVFGAHTPCSSSKPLTGHTLGAAGILETALCWLSMQRRYNPEGRLIPHLWDRQLDAELTPVQLVSGAPAGQLPETCLSNSFAFGGNNSSVILARQTAQQISQQTAPRKSQQDTGR